MSFPDVPEAHTFGKNEQEAMDRGLDALETALMLYMDFDRKIPAPSPVGIRGKFVVLSALTEAKIALYEEMRKRSTAT